GNITFKDACLTYPDSGIDALQHINLTIQAGESLGILGTTGAGKSTIANLICRMYDTTKGAILIDGHPINEYNLSYLRSQIGYVPQEVFLFSDSIRNNIIFGSENQFTEEEIMQAAKDADLYNNVKDFPKGFDTELGERGITLSGGQKQRASIARAIIRNPKILILDDCLSAVDTKTENVILNNLGRIMQGRTSIIISHRISSVKLADKIVVLDGGRIIQQGTHDTLINQAGMYRELYERQLQAEEV
ncbi:MAG: ABC transporter ATP-binding protein, partial [Thermoflexibacteraceae bacterium]